MDTDHKEFLAAAHLKFSKFKELSEQSGPDVAWEKMLEGFPEQQQHRMSPFIANATLAEGFTKAIPFFKSAGMEMEVVDISNRGIDAVLEIQKYCPYLLICKEHCFATPCHVICEMHIEATRRSFPKMQGKLLSRQALGDCICLFKYERQAK